jgi:hypothetical protein
MKEEALAAHKLRHEQRAVEKNWKQQAKGEVQAAVRNVKDELKGKSTELQKAQKALTQVGLFFNNLPAMHRMHCHRMPTTGSAPGRRIGMCRNCSARHLTHFFPSFIG